MANRCCKNCGHELVQQGRFCANCAKDCQEKAETLSSEADVATSPRAHHAK